MNLKGLLLVQAKPIVSQRISTLVTAPVEGSSIPCVLATSAAIQIGVQLPSYFSTFQTSHASRTIDSSCPLASRPVGVAANERASSGGTMPGAGLSRVRGVSV